MNLYRYAIFIARACRGSFGVSYASQLRFCTDYV